MGWLARTTLTLWVAVALVAAPAARADVMLQGFYWDVPSPGLGQQAPWWWDHLAASAAALREAGFTALWIPPVTKGNSGRYSVGYDPFDDYDLCSKDQKGSVYGRYGTREQLERCVAVLRANGLNVYVDLVENHRVGDPADAPFRFLYRDALGHAAGGRFEKGPGDFHPNVPQDPNVPDGPNEVSFGRDLAPVNGTGHRTGRGLDAAADWTTRALDIQGYRLDYVKGISSDWLREMLDYGAMRGKFAVAEFWDGDTRKVEDWVTSAMGGRASAFDFPLRGLLKEMCDGAGAFDMRRLDHAGLAGIDPRHAVTFVENHDTDRNADRIVAGKALAYAYILTSEGYPCVFWRDYSEDPGCYHMRSRLDPLIRVREDLAKGSTLVRWKDADAYVFERTGGKRLLVGLNDSPTVARKVTVGTGFGPGRLLHDYVGRSPDVRTDRQGRATIAIPANADGSGYVCYAPAGQMPRARRRLRSVTQEYAGAADLDIRPAGAEPTTVCRVWAAAGTSVRGRLRLPADVWSSAPRFTLRLLGPDGRGVGIRSYRRTGVPDLVARAASTGWHTFRIEAASRSAPASGYPYWLAVTYTAPGTLGVLR